MQGQTSMKKNVAELNKMQQRSAKQGQENVFDTGGQYALTLLKAGC